MSRPYGEITWEAPDPAAPADALATVAERPRPTARPRATQRRERPKLPTVRLLGIELHAITETRAIAHILDELDAGSGGGVLTPHPYPPPPLPPAPPLRRP